MSRYNHHRVYLTIIIFNMNYYYVKYKYELKTLIILLNIFPVKIMVKYNNI